MSVDFSFTVRKLKDKYVLVARSYGVVVWASELAAGVKELEERVQAVMRDYDEAGVAPVAADDGDMPNEETATEEMTRGRAPRPRGGYPMLYASFFSKLAIVPVFVAVFIVVGVAAFSKILGSSSVIGLALEHPARFIVQIADRADELSPSEIQELKLAIRRIIAKVAPLAEELKIPSGQPPSTPESAPK